MSDFDWNNATVGERAAYNAGYSKGAENPTGETALLQIMRSLGKVCASHSEIAKAACKAIEACTIWDSKA